jgi:FAD/FMN-containing dehydrogenase
VDRREFVRRAAAVGASAALPAWARRWTSATADGPVAVLARILDGDVVIPGSARYPSARLLWDTRFDGLKPRAIAYCASVADVERIVRWARARRIHVVPRSGGHSYAGYSSGDRVVVADVSRLAGVAVSDSRATVGAGAKLFDVYAALASHGVTIPGGSCPTVGIAGLALGGGVGYSSRRFGTTADNLRRLKIVTADSQSLVCDASHHADLFWACRGGGGGNFGIVTDLTFATHPVSTVSTYEIEWPWTQAPQAVAAWQAFAPHAPDALFSVLDLIATVPSSPSARSHVVSAGQYFGPESDLPSLLQPLTSAGTPIRVVTHTLDYLDAVLHWAGCRDAATCTEARSAFAAKSDYVSEPLVVAAISTLVNGIAARQGRGRAAIYLDAYGGAINRVPTAATAFVHRDAMFSIQYTAEWSGAGSDSASLAWLAALYAQMRPHVSGFAYQNYIDPQLSSWRHAYYGANLARLQAVKRKVDRHGFFRFPQSIVR